MYPLQLNNMIIFYSQVTYFIGPRGEGESWLELERQDYVTVEEVCVVYL
jgi:hypothetical protein